jgi:hypothetical protein
VLILLPALALAGPSFIDASDRFDGIEVVSMPVDGAGYTGAAMLDYDGDGDLDVYIGNGPGQANFLLDNDGSARFVDVAARAGAEVRTGTGGVLAADLDEDGLPDLVLPGDRAALRTLRNNGDGTFRDVTVRSGLMGARRNTMAHAADVNSDGWLDVFIGGGIVPDQNYMNTLWINQQDGTFVETAASAGVQGAVGLCTASFANLDADDHIDLLVGNCNDLELVPQPMEVYRGLGDGTFEDVYVERQIWEIGHFMAFAWLDLDADGWLDVFATNVGVSEFRDGPHVLYRNDGDGTFTDVAAEAGVADLVFGWGAVAADFDNDGWEDLYYVGRAHAPDAVFSPGLLLMNNGDGTFAEPEIPVDLGHLWTSGLVVGDLDGNGFPDLVAVANAAPWEGASGRPALLLNEGNDNHWVTVRLRGTTSGRQALGARIRAYTPGHAQLRELRAGDGYLSTSTPWPTFGLGQDTQARLCVRWPDGQGEDFGTLAADQVVELVQGAGIGPDPCGPPEPGDTGGPTDTGTHGGTDTDSDTGGGTGTTGRTDTLDSVSSNKRFSDPPPACGCRAGGPSGALWAVLVALTARR